MLNLDVRELSLVEDKVDEDFVVLILRWESALKVMLVSCSEMVVPLLSVASGSSSSRDPCAVRGRVAAAWLFDLAWLARVFGLGTDGFSAAPFRSGPKFLAKLLLAEEFVVEEAGRGRLSYC